MVFARTSKAAARLSEQIRIRSFRKTYNAVLIGELQESSGRLVNIIVKNNRSNMVEVLPDDNSGGSGAGWAALDYNRIGSADGLTLVSIGLITGRPHQIRAQFAYHGYPVIGDRKYGVYARGKAGADTGARIASKSGADTGARLASESGVELGSEPGSGAWYAQGTKPGSVSWHTFGAVAVKWPALWARSLEFDHPITGKRIRFNAGIPKHFPWDIFKGKTSGADYT
jgi:23S rRNA-/tRNA-specific pseudouridylate synthase